MEPIIIIPARRGSTRLADKMLIEIEGKPLIRWTVEAAMATGYRVVLATDCPQIVRAGEILNVSLSDQPYLNGTERCIDTAKGWTDYSMIINWQGDSPLTRPESVVQLAEAMAEIPWAVGTLQQQVNRPATDGEVAVIHSCHDGLAASFYRPLPGSPIHYRHLGIYAIKPEAAELYGKVPSVGEAAQGLEQMRWLDRGVAMATVTVPDYPALEINTEADIGKFKTVLESARETM